MSSDMTDEANYDRIINAVFDAVYREGLDELRFDLDLLKQIAAELGIPPDNAPDIAYSYRSGRRELTEHIKGFGNWAIFASQTRGEYVFRLLENAPTFHIPFNDFAIIDIPNAIPDVVESFLRVDEQSLLTRILYNRLLDIFTGLTCYHIQNHLRSSATGQVEIDALYVAVGKNGELTIIPIEAKAVRETDIGRYQITQMVSYTRTVYPTMRHRIIGVKMLDDGSICMIEFSDATDPDEIKIVDVARYRLIHRST